MVNEDPPLLLADNMEEHQWLAYVIAVGFIIYLIVVIIGLPANLFVLVKMLRLKRRKPDVFRCGTGACLLVMAVADLCSLIAIISLGHVSSSFAIPMPDFIAQTGYEVYLCKITIFTMGTATSVAIWSWLLMSILRWLALYHPLLHRTLYDFPVRLLSLILFIASLTNCWLLVTVEYRVGARSFCTQTPLFGNETLTRILLLIEIGWSFVIPIFVVAYLDTAALLSIPKLLRASSMLKSVNPPKIHIEDNFQRKCKRTLARWLLIALVDILLNAPVNILRLMTILGYVSKDDVISPAYVVFKTVSDILYYSQYSFNALYLALFIYDKTISDKKALPSTAYAPRDHRSRKSTNPESQNSSDPDREPLQSL
ncbi:unnamed protein product, partial [Mesorhabditis belari]|uniref:G-protein coupled receptors family 1 profile domain-containing protein n=1 Tax=Mesorhabditis belari TaxID=2138241 RepID=A0AAF3EES2_9BILA